MSDFESVLAGPAPAPPPPRVGGVLVLLFLGWQVWLNDIIVGAEQNKAAGALAEQWEQAPAPDTTTPADPADPGSPVVLATPAPLDAFANLIIPRLGADFRRPIAEGVGTNVISNTKTGVGHYPGTQMPGEVGNFAVAAHRTTYGGTFHDINTLLLGDSIYVETQDGWYRYVYRGTEYVRPTGVGVLDPVPQIEGMPPTDRIITMTSCHPYYSAAERIVAYGVFDTWYPRAGGPPPEIATLVQAGGN